LNGLSLPIQLANTVIEERMHKAHFHFAYRQKPPAKLNDPDQGFRSNDSSKLIPDVGLRVSVHFLLSGRI